MEDHVENFNSPEMVQEPRPNGAVGAFLGMVDKIKTIQEHHVLQEAIKYVDSIARNYRSYLALTLLTVSMAIGQIEPPQQSNRKESTDNQPRSSLIEEDLFDRTPTLKLTNEPTKSSAKQKLSRSQRKNITSYHTQPVAFAPEELTKEAPLTSFTQTETIDSKYTELEEKFGISAEKAKLIDQLSAEISAKYEIPQIPPELIIVLTGIESLWTFENVDHTAHRGKNPNGTEDFGPFGINEIFIKDMPHTKYPEITKEDAQDFEMAARWAIRRLAEQTNLRKLNTQDKNQWIDGLVYVYNQRPAYLENVHEYLEIGRPEWAISQ